PWARHGAGGVRRARLHHPARAGRNEHARQAPARPVLTIRLAALRRPDLPAHALGRRGGAGDGRASCPAHAVPGPSLCQPDAAHAPDRSGHRAPLRLRLAVVDELREVRPAFLDGRMRRAPLVLLYLLAYLRLVFPAPGRETWLAAYRRAGRTWDRLTAAPAPA